MPSFFIYLFLFQLRNKKINLFSDFLVSTKPRKNAYPFFNQPHYSKVNKIGTEATGWKSYQDISPKSLVSLDHMHSNEV